MPAKLKTTGTFLALCLGSMLAIAQLGCLTPEQRADQAAFQTQLDKDAATVLDLKAEIDKYRAELAAVAADVKAGKLPVASGLDLADKIMANLSATQGKLAAAQADISATQEKLKKLQESGAPWWAYAIPGLLTAAQLAGTLVPQLSFLVPVAAALKGKLAVTTEIAGSLSRTTDALGVAPAIKEQLMLEEMSRDEVATRADYDEIRSLAKAGQI